MTDDDSNWVKSLGYFSTIVGDIAGCTGVSVGIGYFICKQWGAPWILMLPTSLAGLTLAFYRLYRMMLRDNNGQK